ncbi:MAG: trigger factor [Treponema sp.]|nr:trigger factor [Treponema sp.]MBR6913711.1 trigger factor [Treponema sp.]
MKVTKEIEKLGKSSVKLTVTVAKKDVADGYNETLKQYVKHVQIPGFRKGHVPAKVLESKYGEQIKAESISELINKALDEIFKDEKDTENRPLPYAQPVLQEMPALDVTKELKFAVTYDVFPEVEIKNFDGIEVKEPETEIGDEEVAEELKGIQERNAVVIDKKDDTVAKDDIVTINIVEKDESGNEIASTKRDGFTFTVGTAENVYKIDDEIVGMKKDETKEISKTYAADDSDAELAGKTKKYSVTVSTIKFRELPKLDDDLAQDVNEKFKTLDELKADIKKQLENAKNRRISEIKSNSLLEQLVEKNAFEIPESMLNAELDARWRMMANQFRTTPEELEKLAKASGQTKEDMLKNWTAEAEKMLKSRIIVDTLLKEKNITVTPEEIDAEYSKIAEQNGLSLDEVKKHYEDARAKEYLIDSTKEQKLYEELYKQVKVSKGDKVKFADLFKN